MKTGTETVDTDILRTDGNPDIRIRHKKTEQVVNIGLAANALLAAVKLFTGIVGHSQALLADGVNSISDVVYLIVVKILVTLSGKPADEEHPYGHQQFESVAALVVGAFVITTGLAIFWNSVSSGYDVLTGKTDRALISYFTLFVALGTVVIKTGLMINAATVGKRVRSIAVLALARDHRNDIFASLGAGIGILLSLLGYPLFDPVAGAVVAVIIARTGADILRESAHELMESVPSAELEAHIRDHMRAIPDVLDIESVHAHRFGPYFIVNITICVDGRQTVDKGNEIADRVEAHLCSSIDMLRKIYVHVHPAHTKT
ncbi:MAG: cation diffusion facilitator family transporter [Chitinispirillaceae bacterium]|jgi:cation diffusion facilitator family transporter|nr:cation diffusion facilitator family transporter [Chitinispirillaceae bacterium]